MTMLYFTGTGNSLYVAKQLGEKCLSIPQLIKAEIYEFEDEEIGIIIPCYHGGIPKMIEKFLDKVTLKSNYIFGVITYGSFAGAPSTHLQQIAKRNNIEFSYVDEILMVDNYLPLFDINKEVDEIPNKNIEQNIKRIQSNVKNRKRYLKKNSLITEGIRRIIDKFYNHHFQENFSINNNCNSCAICEKVCPVNNITVEIQPIFKDNCQHCLSCIHHCPQKAINIKKEKSMARFRNEHVALKEIITANQ